MRTSSRRSIRPFLVAAVVALSVLMGAASASAATGSPSAATEASMQNLLTTQLAVYAAHYGGYADGVWRSSDTTCWACNNGGPATASATAWLIGGRTNHTL